MGAYVQCGDGTVDYTRAVSYGFKMLMKLATGRLYNFRESGTCVVLNFFSIKTTKLNLAKVGSNLPLVRLSALGQKHKTFFLFFTHVG
jgi:hypothetical protein